MICKSNKKIFILNHKNKRKCEIIKITKLYKQIVKIKTFISY